MATALVAIEGVLRTETGDPIPEGIKFYRVLCEHYRVVLCSDESPEATEHWLRSNLIFGHAEVFDNSLSFEGQELRSRHISVARSKGKLELFVDSDADSCAEALESGIPTIMFASPRFVRTKRSVKPWEALSTEVVRQREALLDAHLGSRIKRYE
jgi:hypothetical protein